MINNKILITGSTGFLGHNLIPKLINKGYNILVPTRHDMNLLDSNSVNQFFANNRFNHIIHLAALAGGIGVNRQNPYSFLVQNQLMNINLFNAAIEYKIDKIVTIGSVCAYPKFAPVPFIEDDIWKGYPEETNAPYGQSKRDLMIMCEGAYRQHGINAIHLIPTNLYGKYDNFNEDTSHVIPAIIKKIKHAIDNNLESIELWGDGSASRDFLYVEDCCDAIITAYENYNSYKPLNLGSGEEVRIYDLAWLIAELMGFRGNIAWNDSYPNGQPRRKLDCNLTYQELGWKAHTQLRDGLKRVIEWYR